MTIGIVLCVLGVLCFILEWFLLAFPLIIFGGMAFFSGVEDNGIEKFEAEEKYRQEMDLYTRRVQRNAEINANRSRNEAGLRVGQQRLSVLTQRLSSAESLLKELYSANIIPSKYRNIYAAYYLYDYFNTSREDDLDKIIQTLLLDEIVQRLGTIIAQNEQILLNQRVQMALQERNNRILAENHREQMEHIARIESNQELQLEYQNIIAKHQVATSYFLAADYLYKH